MNITTIYQDVAGERRWRIENSQNGETVGASSEGFSSKQVCKNNILLTTLSLAKYLQDNDLFPNTSNG